MKTPALSCPKCLKEMPAPAVEGAGATRCPHCATQVEFEAFPAFFSGPRIGRAGDPLVDANEASCFFHEEKRAVIACENCGRFLCALCDLEMSGHHVCPKCLAAGRKKGAWRNFDQFRLSWPGTAVLVTIVLPIALYPLTPVFALAALVLVAIGFFKPGSITGRRPYLLYFLAVLLAVGEIVGSVYVGRGLFESFTSAVHYK